jgi:hypothetical protein
MQKDRLLVRMLMIIDEADSYPTRKLLKRLGPNDLHSMLAKAEKDGYIQREERKPEETHTFSKVGGI